MGDDPGVVYMAGVVGVCPRRPVALAGEKTERPEIHCNAELMCVSL